MHIVNDVSDVAMLSYDHVKKIYIELTSKYSAYIIGFGDGLVGYNSVKNKYDFDYPTGVELRDNILSIGYKLMSFKNYGYQNMNNSYQNMNNDIPNSKINIVNNLTANQTQNVTLSFEEAKQRIKNMTGLSDTETQEAIQKVEEIKVILESHESKKTKWAKIKPILLWIADKSVDIGTALLPLLLGIGQ